jgi:ATP-dependent Clp protease ATP-binding subunit ClpC
MYERFTVRARQVMELSRLEAVRCRHACIGTEHLLLGLVREGTGIATRILQSHAVNLEVVKAEIEAIVQSGSDRVSLRHLPQTPRAQKAIEFSIEEAHDLKHGCVGTEHLLLGLLREHEGVAAQVLTRLGLTVDGVGGKSSTFTSAATSSPKSPCGCTRQRTLPANLERGRRSRNGFGKR